MSTLTWNLEVIEKEDTSDISTANTSNTLSTSPVGDYDGAKERDDDAVVNQSQWSSVFKDKVTHKSDSEEESVSSTSGSQIELFMVYSQAMQTQQCAELLLLKTSEDFSDVTFIVGTDQKEYHLHRVFMAMNSLIFNAMFFERVKETQPRIVIEDIEPDIFECIINFAYCNDPKITSKNILPVIVACENYKITKLQDICFESFKSILDFSNFHSYFDEALNLFSAEHKVHRIINEHFAEHMFDCVPAITFGTFLEKIVKLDLSILLSQCLVYISHMNEDQISKVFVSFGFRKMSLETMRLFLKSQMNCKEEELWDAVQEWADHHDRYI